METRFDNSLVQKVSVFLQEYMKLKGIESLSADEGAFLLAEQNVLTNKIGPKPGFNFRQMLRDGRDGLIDLVEGAYQVRPNTKWTIHRKEN